MTGVDPESNSNTHNHGNVLWHDTPVNYRRYKTTFGVKILVVKRSVESQWVTTLIISKVCIPAWHLIWRLFGVLWIWVKVWGVNGIFNFGRDWGWHSFVYKAFPVKTLVPFMFLDIFQSISLVPNSLSWVISAQLLYQMLRALVNLPWELYNVHSL